MNRCEFENDYNEKASGTMFMVFGDQRNGTCKSLTIQRSSHYLREVELLQV